MSPVNSAQLCTMIGQVDRMLGRLTAYGSSSRLAKARGDHSLAIRSFGRHHHLQRSFSGFLRYAHAHGVNRLGQLRPHHGVAWIQNSTSDNTQSTRAQDLAWLERAIQQEMGLHLHLIPRDAQVHRVDVGTGQFSPGEQQAIIERAYDSRNPALGTALEYGATLGLRPSEIVALRVGDYDRTAGVLHVPGLKWGHPRDVTVPETLRPGLEALADGRGPDDHLHPDVSARGLERIVATALAEMGLGDDPRSLMAFRGAFADQEYDIAREAGLNDADARRQVATQMGHGNTEIRPRIDISRDYYLSRRDAQ